MKWLRISCGPNMRSMIQPASRGCLRRARPQSRLPAPPLGPDPSHCSWTTAPLSPPARLLPTWGGTPPFHRNSGSRYAGAPPVCTPDAISAARAVSDYAPGRTLAAPTRSPAASGLRYVFQNRSGQRPHHVWVAGGQSADRRGGSSPVGMGPGGLHVTLRDIVQPGEGQDAVYRPARRPGAQTDGS